MDGSSKKKITGAIDIGAHALRMKISEIGENGGIYDLEMLQYPISMGKDTFATGKVSFKTVEAVCGILEGFKQLLKQYNIKSYRTVATSAVREAENKDYIIDQIRLKTGLNIDVIDTSEERFLVYKAVDRTIHEIDTLDDKRILMADIGAGSMHISIYSENRLTFSQNIRLGSLRIREVLSSVERRTLNFSGILEEFIEASLDGLKLFHPQAEYQHFVASGGGIHLISNLLRPLSKSDKFNYIEKDKFEALYGELLKKPSHVVAKEYNVSLDEAELLLPTMMICKIFLNMTTAPGIYAPMVSLVDGVVYDLAEKEMNKKNSGKYIKDIISPVRALARRYRCDESHASFVEQAALKLFDALKGLHGLGGEERLLFQIAAILHDIGKFINMNQHSIHSYEIIMASDLIGISREKLEIIANVACYHGSVVPAASHWNFHKLDRANRMVCAKLIAIIRIANALDRSHKQKIKDMGITTDDQKLIVKVEHIEDMLLEQWMFETKSVFFQEVFGITPVLKLKRKIEHG